MELTWADCQTRRGSDDALEFLIAEASAIQAADTGGKRAEASDAVSITAGSVISPAVGRLATSLAPGLAPDPAGAAGMNGTRRTGIA